MYKSKICPICNNDFLPKSSRQKYCNSPVIRKCVICGKEYDSVCNITYAKCCSKECTDKYAHQQSVESYKGRQVTCVLCGKEFTPKNNTQKICNDRHFKPCVICGKSFEVVWKPGRNIDDIAKTCSPECKTKATFINGNPMQREECREKAKQTIRDRYGVEHPMQNEEVKAKMDATMYDRYGVKRFTQTKEYIDKAMATNQAKYGTDWARQNPEIQKKSEDTLFEHYGITNPMQSEEFKSKVKDTYKERTGYDSPMHNPEVIRQIKETNLNNYGVEYAIQNSEIWAKAKDTMVDRYGVPYALQSEDIKARVRETNEQRYGYDNPAKSPVIQAKISNTMLEKYGHVRYSQTDTWHLGIMKNPTRIEYFNEFKQNPKIFIHKYFKNKPTLEELYEITGVGYESIATVLDRWNCREDVAFNYSTMEREVANALISINPDINLVYNTHKIIYPYEIDIYLPDYNIGIECNPTVTHNSSIGFLSDKNKPTPKKYHKIKSDLCEKAGVFLFHIFGYEWVHRRDVIISMLRNLLGRNEVKLYARNTCVKEVPAPETAQFLNAYHRQGNAQSPIRLGLYTKATDELVSVMTFGKMRGTIGTSKNEDTSDVWELIRFCNKTNTTVVGSASKLFKHFIQTYNPECIRSFSDRAHTRGNLYQQLGFTEVRRSDPGYVWVDAKTDTPYHRINAQKAHIKDFLKDDSIDTNKQSERQIMIEHGYVQVYDSGTITWQWTK